MGAPRRKAGTGSIAAPRRQSRAFKPQGDRSQQGLKLGPATHARARAPERSGARHDATRRRRAVRPAAGREWRAEDGRGARDDASADRDDLLLLSVVIGLVWLC